MDPITQLTVRLNKYLERTGTNATTFGIVVANNSALVPRLRNGNVNSKTLRTIAQYLDSMERKEKRRAKR